MSTPLTDLSGIGPSTAKLLQANQIGSIEDLAVASLAEIMAVPGFGEIRALRIKEAAVAALGATEEPTEPQPTEPEPAEPAAAENEASPMEEREGKKKKTKKEKQSKIEKKDEKKKKGNKKKEKKDKKDRKGKKKK